MPCFCHDATVSSTLSFDIEAPASSIAFIADLIAGVRKVIFHFIKGIWILVCFNKPVQAIPDDLSAIAVQL
jgi:hypothetical protein